MAEMVSDSTGLRRASVLTEEACSSRPAAKKHKALVSQDSVVGMIVEQSEEGEELQADEISEVAKQDGGSAVENINHETSEVVKQGEEQGETNAMQHEDAEAEERTVSVNETPGTKLGENTDEKPEEDGEESKMNGAVSVNGSTDAAAGGDGNTEEKPPSKRAQKKLKKQEKYAQKKQEMKAREKEMKKERKEKKSQEWNNLSAEEKEAAVERAREARRVRMEESNKRKEKQKATLDAVQNLVIDFQFSEQMTEQEVAHMGQQIMYSYAANVKAEVPVRLSLTSLQGSMKQQLERISGNEHWLVHREERPYIDVFSDRKQDLVYLTADSENVLDRLDESKIYIVGGIVDHNRMKCITFNRAKEQGIATARFPIQENMKLTSSTVLTVNQVVEIVLEFLNCKDWAQALKTVIPQRKIAAQ